MHFPVYLEIGPLHLHPHQVFEVLAYSLGFQFYRWRRKRAGDAIGDQSRGWVVAGAIVGAFFGSKVVFWLTEPVLTAQHWADWGYMMGGKTIVGGLAGGLLGVELVKKRLGVTRSTGDVFALPIALGMILGRIGCFLTGLDDHTHGLATRLPWGVDFGDGVLRHPTQLYEAGFLALLAGWLLWRERRPHREGALFASFLGGYMAFRFFAEFIKPGVPLLGLSAIQWTCVAVLAHYALGALQREPRPEVIHG